MSKIITEETYIRKSHKTKINLDNPKTQEIIRKIGIQY